MDLFEILFIALFILFPILEQVFRKKREGDEEGEGAEPMGPEPMEAEPGEVGPRSEDRRPVKAADMVPDDLWAVLTGEERPSEGVGWKEEDEVWFGGSPWEEESGRGYEADDERADEPVAVELPEAYSMEPVDVKVVSLEESLPTPEARHRRFHEIIDREPVRRKRQRSAVGRALRTSEGARQAFVLSEVLGTPRGLEP